MSAKFNILLSDPACTGCIKSYKKKHDLKPGDTFDISCVGIPKEYVTASMGSSVPEENLKSMVSMLDPVTWAAEVLDWHCIDPDGAIWKRKTEENTLDEVTPYIDEVYGDLVTQGKSAFNRPYQAEMLRCTAKRKVFRLGRQAGKTESICVAILHAVFTHKDFKVLVITPYQTQIEVIFNRLNKLIKSREATNNSLKRYVKAPNYTIELHNGSTIKGFTAGTKSGGNADAVRGQKANMLVFDEADYLAAADMASALAVITNYPDATVWMSSTPTGKREKFYEACYNKLWREFYYPSWINPLWNDELEAFYRSELSTIEYQHEVAANFGEQEQGVYQGKYIDEALTDFKYEHEMKRDGWEYCIGVDWNDVKTGTTIAVVGYNPVTSVFRLVDRYIVSKEGWTQMAACQKIIELNAHWRPAWIYIDKGFGGTQDEVLRKYGWDMLAKKGKNHPDSRLSKIVKTYDFGSKVKIKDLFTRQDREKPSKPFLVENSVRRFEQRHIEISKYDNQIEAELRGYIIDHVTVTGTPVYKQGNEKIGDHNLDALNLALVAFTLEMTPFGLVKYDTGIGFTGYFGEESKPISSILEAKKTRDKPEMSRTEVIEGKTSLLGDTTQKPGVLAKETGRRLWNWPGFEHDAPRPKPRQITSVMGKRPLPPSRKKF